MFDLVQSHLRMNFLFLPQTVGIHSFAKVLGIIFIGIWECYDPQEVVDIARYHISLGATLTQTCTFIIDTCVAPIASSPYGRDNMTIAIVAFLHGQTKEEWMKWMATRVAEKAGYATPSRIPQIYSEKRVKHPARVTPNFDFTLFPPAEPVQSPSHVSCLEVIYLQRPIQAVGSSV